MSTHCGVPLAALRVVQSVVWTGECGGWCKRVGAGSSEDFRKRLLNEAGVAVLADIHFGTPVEGEGQHIRFSYASSFPAIDDGLGRITDFMKKNTR